MLYIHIPYCHHKCTYCGFYSVAGRRSHEAYVGALCHELEARRLDRPPQTLYVGGGTPSQLSPDHWRRIAETLHRHYDLTKLVEATVEANPEDLTPDYLHSLRQLGLFSRLSIGIQSFADSELRLLNRVHTAAQAVAAVRNAAAAGFVNISIDLMMGLPGQGLDNWRANLDAAARLMDEVPEVRHLSCYELTVEPGTMLERQLATGRVQRPDDETLASQYQHLMDWSASNGLEQYEISNFCRPGHRSRHNSRYWDRTPYLGVGAAAHSFDGRRRRWNVADVEAYINGATAEAIPHEEELLTDADAFNEYVMTALRTANGIAIGLVDSRFREHLSKKIRPFVETGLIAGSATGYRATPDGLLHADGIAAALFV